MHIFVPSCPYMNHFGRDSNNDNDNNNNNNKNNNIILI